MTSSTNKMNTKVKTEKPIEKFDSLSDFSAFLFALDTDHSMSLCLRSFLFSPRSIVIPPPSHLFGTSNQIFLSVLLDMFFLCLSAKRIPSDNPEYFPFLIFRQLLDHRDQLLCILARLVQCVSSFPQLLTSFL